MRSLTVLGGALIAAAAAYGCGAQATAVPSALVDELGGTASSQTWDYLVRQHTQLSSGAVERDIQSSPSIQQCPMGFTVKSAYTQPALDRSVDLNADGRICAGAVNVAGERRLLDNRR